MAMGRKTQVKIGEIDVPKDYFTLSIEDKKEVCEYMADKIYTMLNKSVTEKEERDYLANQIIKSSLITNELEENYEMCQVLVDIRNLINEPTD